MTQLPVVVLHKHPVAAVGTIEKSPPRIRTTRWKTSHQVRWGGGWAAAAAAPSASRIRKSNLHSNSIWLNCRTARKQLGLREPSSDDSFSFGGRIGPAGVENCRQTFAIRPFRKSRVVWAWSMLSYRPDDRIVGTRLGCGGGSNG